METRASRHAADSVSHSELPVVPAKLSTERRLLSRDRPGRTKTRHLYFRLTILNNGGASMSGLTTTDGVEIFYKDWGSGQPIVFSHGWPLSAT